MKYTLASARTFPPSESEGWTIHFIERQTRYWVAAHAGQKREQLFEQGTASAWKWAEPAKFIRWFTDGERRYGDSLVYGSNRVKLIETMGIVKYGDKVWKSP
jgi:hypothetical protein